MKRPPTNPGLPPAALVILAGLTISTITAVAQDTRKEIFFVPPSKPGELVVGTDGRSFMAPLGDEEGVDRTLGEVYGFDPPRQRADRPPAPADHEVDYLRRHGAKAKADPTSCASCHTSQSCLDCHRKGRAVNLHPPGYIAYHPIDARRSSAGCATCHSPQLFCRDCHLAVRAGTGRAAPRAGVAFHPASWLGQTPGPDHGREARMNLAACTSCHSESDCVTCHVAINPHPPGFRGNCKPLISRSPSMCGRCHNDVGMLQLLCR